MGAAGVMLLAAGLSMDAFAVSVCKGLSLGKIRLKDMFIVGAVSYTHLTLPTKA